jgi:DNA primase
MEPNTISPAEYLSAKGVSFREFGKELIAHCPFNGCDEDSRGKEAHFYVSSETGQYQCKKCAESGNLFDLARHFGDDVRTLFRDQNPPFPAKKKEAKKPVEEIATELVERCHQALPPNIRTYLNARGIPDDLISQFKIGWGEFYGANWIVIPIPKKDNPQEYALLKLRRDPEAKEEKTSKMKVWPMEATHELFD